MANLVAKDGSGTTQYIGATGAGTDADPLILRRQDAGVGGPADAAATADTGTFSLVALLKRLLSAKLPDPISGRIPTDASLAVYGSPTLTATPALSGPSFAIEKFTRLRLQVNNGPAALTGFEISTRAHAGADWQVHLNTAGHYTSPAAGSILVHCANLGGTVIDPTSLAANGKVVLALNFTQFFAQEIRVRATSGSSSLVQLYWGAG
jgi:hypothetical protein